MALFSSASAPSTPLPTRGEPIITLKDIEKTIDLGGQPNWLLRRITLDIKAGEFVTIMGPSGAGKSTLLAILGMLDHEWRG